MKESIVFKLEKLSDRYEELAALLSDPDVISDQNKFRDYSKEYSELEPVVQAFAAFNEASSDLTEAEEMMTDSDPDMREMAKEEYPGIKARIEGLEADLEILLLPKDPNDSRNVFLEVRAGTGGDEAAILLVICSVCIPVMRKYKAGVLKSLVSTTVIMADIKKLSPVSSVPMYIPN